MVHPKAALESTILKESFDPLKKSFPEKRVDLV
jgi:hypothetical protein